MTIPQQLWPIFPNMLLLLWLTEPSCFSRVLKTSCSFTCPSCGFCSGSWRDDQTRFYSNGFAVRPTQTSISYPYAFIFIQTQPVRVPHPFSYPFLVYSSEATGREVPGCVTMRYNQPHEPRLAAPPVHWGKTPSALRSLSSSPLARPRRHLALKASLVVLLDWLNWFLATLKNIWINWDHLKTGTGEAGGCAPNGDTYQKKTYIYIHIYKYICIKKTYPARIKKITQYPGATVWNLTRFVLQT